MVIGDQLNETKIVLQIYLKCYKIFFNKTVLFNLKIFEFMFKFTIIFKQVLVYYNI